MKREAHSPDQSAILIYDPTTLEFWPATGDEHGYQKVTVSDPISDYKISNIDSSGATQYFGFLDKYGNWYIMKLTATQCLYFKGTSGYSGNWDVDGKYVGILEFDYFNNIF